MENLKLGSTGSLVGLWQSFLTENGFFPGPVDNKFGNRTQVATQNFQSVHNLPGNGEIGNDLYKMAKEYGFTSSAIYQKWEKGLLAESIKPTVTLNQTLFENLKYNQYEEFFNNYIDELSGSKYLRDSGIRWCGVNKTINVIVIRCNDIYITNNMKRNNDWMIVIENTKSGSFKRYIFKVTADPKYRRDKIANLMEQVYFGNSRNHRSQPNRIAICQDTCQVFVKRYKGPTWYEDLGFFGINIHNPKGFFNSSLGCVILAKDSDYLNDFRPLLKRVSKSRIPVAVIRNTDFARLISQV